MIKLTITPGDWPQIVGTGSESNEIVSINQSAELLFSEGDEEGARVVLENALELIKLRAAIKDMAKYIWRGDWVRLDHETRALMGEKE